MNLEALLTRGLQLAKAIEDTTQSVFILRGHKAEVDFQIQEHQRLAAEEAEAKAKSEAEKESSAVADAIPVESEEASEVEC